jgi:hypothetical protein
VVQNCFVGLCGSSLGISNNGVSVSFQGGQVWSFSQSQQGGPCYTVNY